MKKLLALLLLCSTVAYGQGISSMLPGPGTVHSTGGGGFAGRGDLNALASDYSCSLAYSAATRGTNACRICTSAGIVCVDVASDATTGIVPNPSPGGTPCTTTCVITTIYDQAGGGRHMTQTTAANMALYKPPGSCTGFSASIGCIFSNTSTQYSVASWTLAQPYSVVWSARRDASTAVNTDIFYSFGNEFGAGSFGANNDALCYAGAGGLNPTATDATPHAIGCSVNSPSSNIRVDSTNTAGDPGTGTLSGNFSFLWSIGSGGRNYQGFVVDAGIAASNFTTTDLANQNSNAHTNGGF